MFNKKRRKKMSDKKKVVIATTLIGVGGALIASGFATKERGPQ